MRILERSANQWGKDKESHLLRYALTNNHKAVELKDFKINDTSYHNNSFITKSLKDLYIKQYKQSLKTQEKSVKSKLFNQAFI